MSMVTKGFKVGAYMPVGSLAYLAENDTFFPCYNPSHGGLKVHVVDTLLAGDFAAVDCGEYYGIGPSPTVRDGMKLRALTDEERARLEEEGIE